MLSMRRVIGCGIAVFILPFLILCAPQARGLDGNALDRSLAALDSGDIDGQIRAFYDMVYPYSGASAMVGVGIDGLLKQFPERAERIKTSLIGALDKAAEYRRKQQESGEGFDANFSDYWPDLMIVVGAFGDQRAVRGLLAGMDRGGIAARGLSDLCPGSLDSLIAALQEPERYFRGTKMHWRSGAVTAIGLCFQRPMAMRTDAEAGRRGRLALLSALGDADPDVRAAAASGLDPLRSEPVVRGRLEQLRRTDPHRRALGGGRSAYPIRELAGHILSKPEGNYYYVVRSAGMECEVRPIHRAPQGDRFLGPLDSKADAEDYMCREVDPTRTNAARCWSTVPVRACGQ